MVAPALSPSTRYVHPETTRVYWLSSIANPTLWANRAELNAGKDLTAEVAELSGWNVRALLRVTQVADDNFVPRRPDVLDVDDSSIVFYGDRLGVDIRSLLHRGDEGNIVFLYGGDVAGNRMDVFPVEVAALPRTVTVDGSPAQIAVQFAVTAEPLQDASVPA